MDFKQLTENMEHISRADLALHLDDYLDRVEKEKIAFIICDEGKNDIVLCPADWFPFPVDEDFSCVLGCALRYALGLETDMPAIIANSIKKHIDCIDVNSIGVMISDIDQELKKGVPQEDVWLSLNQELKKKQRELLCW